MGKTFGNTFGNALDTQGTLLNQTGYSDAVITAMIADGYVPIASPADFNAIRAVQTDRVFAAGTKWEATVTTLGLAGKYLQVAHIDMYAPTRVGGAYYNAGAGWLYFYTADTEAGRFSGKYDGAGYVIYGLKSTRAKASIFGITGNPAAGCSIKNMIVLDAEISCTSTDAAIISQRAKYDTVIENCIVSGYVISTSTQVGAIAGVMTDTAKVKNCFSTANIKGTSNVGGIVGILGAAGNVVENVITAGRVIATTSGGRVVGAVGSGTLTNGYYNSDIIGTAGGNGVGKTYLQLTTDMDVMYAGWDAAIWRFTSGKYPILKIAGEQVANMPVPSNLLNEITVDDHIILTWDAPAIAPLGYNVYVDIAGTITKLNTELLTALTYDYTPPGAATYVFYVKAVYERNGFTTETGGGVTTTALFFLVELVKVDGDNIIFADAQNQTYITTMQPAVAKEYEGVEAAIPLTLSFVTNGVVVGDWLGVGTIIDRTYEDAKRVITQQIKVLSRKVSISNQITYKTDVKIEYEGFKITSTIPFDKYKNIFATGSNQAIIDNTGMYFHNGNYTYHRVLADINADFKWKQYHNADSENCELAIVLNPVARILYQPDGYESSFTMSNHADSQTIESLRVVHYGNSNVNAPDYGTKGLTSRGIKADWSSYAPSSTVPPDPGVRLGWFDNVEYKTFLTALKAAGTEIIPHSLGTFTEERADAIIWLPEFQTAFVPTNWTDHDLLTGNGRIGIASKGWDVSDAEHYMMDLFEAAGFDKAWNYVDVVDDLVSSTIYGFDHQIAYYNDHVILPVSGQPVLLWQSSDRPFFRNWLDLQKLIDDLGHIDAHDYIANSISRLTTADNLSMIYTHYTDGSDLKITTGFDRALQKIQAAKAAGKLWNPTNTEFHDYFKKLKAVKIELIDENTIKLTNPGSLIGGFSVLISKRNITPQIGLINMSKKEVKKGTIAWADLPTGESTITF